MPVHLLPLRPPHTGPALPQILARAGPPGKQITDCSGRCCSTMVSVHRSRTGVRMFVATVILSVLLALAFAGAGVPKILAQP